MGATMKFIEDWHKKIWRFWTVRIQVAAAFLTSLMFIDPQVLLGAWNMMPQPVRVLLPDSLFRVIGIVLFASNILTILARPIAQKKLRKSDDPEPEQN